MLPSLNRYFAGSTTLVKGLRILDVSPDIFGNCACHIAHASVEGDGQTVRHRRYSTVLVIYFGALNERRDRLSCVYAPVKAIAGFTAKFITLRHFRHVGRKIASAATSWTNHNRGRRKIVFAYVYWKTVFSSLSANRRQFPPGLLPSRQAPSRSFGLSATTFCAGQPGGG